MGRVVDEPGFWAGLVLLSLIGMGARLTARQPLWAGRARPFGPWELTGLAAALAALVFHCAAMFFAAWVDAVPFLNTSAESVRAMGTPSQLAYWVPAAVFLIALRRLWTPALGALVLTLGGVGVTMFGPFNRTTHLAWIAAAVTTIVVVTSGLMARRGRA